MDTELARTFLAVIERGSFARAADHLHVTQSTVSARIQGLERELGCTLFIRNRGGTRLTAEGRRFQRHAVDLVRCVSRARQALGVTGACVDEIVVGARFGLWEAFMVEWLPALRRAVPAVAVRAEVGFEDELMQGLVEGRVDLGVMYTPQYRPGLTVERLFEDTLVLVTTAPAAGALPGPDYVYVDWGPEFLARHQSCFPDYDGAGITVNIGWLGLQHILRHGGSGYFPHRLIQADLAAGRLHPLPAAPTFALPAHAVYTDDAPSATLERALAILRRQATQASMSSNNTLER